MRGYVQTLPLVAANQVIEAVALGVHLGAQRAVESGIGNRERQHLTSARECHVPNPFQRVEDFGGSVPQREVTGQVLAGMCREGTRSG
jgi:hypothetical protein